MVTKTFCSTYYLFYGPSCHLDVVCDSFNDLLYGGDTQVPGAGGTIPRRSYFQQKIYNSKTTTVRYLPSANSVFLCSLSYTDDQDAVLFAITLRESLAQFSQIGHKTERRFWFKTLPSNRKICHMLCTVPTDNRIYVFPEKELLGLSFNPTFMCL